MRAITRSLLVVLVAVLGVIGLAIAWTTTTAVQLLATTALMMGGTDHSLAPGKDSPSFVTEYLDNAVNLYIDPSFAMGNGTAGPATNAVAVTYPAEFFPVFGSMTFDESVAIGRENLHNCLGASASDCDFNDDPRVEPAVGTVYPPPKADDITVFSYSQSAVVSSLVKQDLIDNYVSGDQKSFIFVANPMRGNGGILMRLVMLPSIPFFGITFYGATPTDSEVLDDNGTPLDPTDDTFAYPSADYVQQYDGLGGDFPFRPVNLLATFNALAGYALLHSGVVDRPASEALFQGKHGDTTYYMFPTKLVPILMPLQMIGVPKPILSFFDEFFRVVIEDAYLREVNPGVPTPATLLPTRNPIALALKLLAAVPVAIDNALEDLGHGRRLGTTPTGPFGVGGPPLPEPPSETLDATSFSALPVEDNTESVVPEARSLMSKTAKEPPADLQPVVGDTDEPESDEPGTAVEEQTEATTPDADKTPPATNPDRPKVRGPIEFDSQEPQRHSSANDVDDAGTNETTPDPTPTDAADDGADAKSAGAKDARRASDHGANTKGAGAKDARGASDHGANTKGAGAKDARGASDHGANTKGAGAKGAGAKDAGATSRPAA